MSSTPVTGWAGSGRREEGRRIDEVKELGHIVCRGVTRGERRQIEARLHQLEDRSQLTVSVRDKVRFHKGRNHDRWERGSRSA